jgi:hypothetical protein
VGPRTGLENVENRKFLLLPGLKLLPLGKTIPNVSHKDDNGPSCPKRGVALLDQLNHRQHIKDRSMKLRNTYNTYPSVVLHSVSWPEAIYSVLTLCKYEVRQNTAVPHRKHTASQL